MAETPPQVEIIITEAQTPHETENIWEKEFELEQQKEAEAKNLEDLNEARKEAEQFVSEVITKATEIVKNGSAVHNEEEEKSQVPAQPEVCVKNEEDEEAKRDVLRNDPELVEKARSFVATVLDKAIEEAHRRTETTQKEEMNVAFDDNIDAESVGSLDMKRKPWYLRARSSLCRFFNRICMCFCNRDDRGIFSEAAAFLQVYVQTNDQTIENNKMPTKKEEKAGKNNKKQNNKSNIRSTP